MVTNKRFPPYGIIGLAFILVAEIGLILKMKFFGIFMTPVCWTGLILFLDAWNYRLSGNSLIMNRRKEFFWMLPFSILFWYVFEFYNLFIQNWHYIGLPENRFIRYFGYFWAFATIWPGVYEIYKLLINLNFPGEVKVKPIKLTGTLLTCSFVFGLACIILPFIVSKKTATYMAAPVWLGMIFFLDPLNLSWRRESIWKDWSRGYLTRLIRLFVAGAIAGILWEFWNYWAIVKWIYIVPIFGHIKIFEMPVVGYLGFLPFAVEIFVMWETARHFLKLS